MITKLGCFDFFPRYFYFIASSIYTYELANFYSIAPVGKIMRSNCVEGPGNLCVKQKLREKRKHDW
jgi:hypothetical protein